MCRWQRGRDRAQQYRLLAQVSRGERRRQRVDRAQGLAHLSGHGLVQVPADHDQLRVENRTGGHDGQGQLLRVYPHHPPGEPVAGPRGAVDVAGAADLRQAQPLGEADDPGRGHRLRAHQLLAGAARREAGQRMEGMRGDEGHDGDLAGRAVHAPVELAADEGAEAEAGSQGDEHEVGHADRRAHAVLGDRGEVHVVLDRAPGTECLVQLVEEAGPVDAGQRGPLDASGRRVRYPGSGDDDRGRVREAQPRAAYRVLGEVGHGCRERTRGTGAVGRRDARQDGTVQIRGGGGLEPAGELEAYDEPGLTSRQGAGPGGDSRGRPAGRGPPAARGSAAPAPG